MSRRGRRVPEAAPLVGLVLAFSVALFGVLFAPTGTLLPVFLVAVLALYAFTAYGILRSDDPTAVLPPDLVLGGGVIVAGLLAGYGVVTGDAVLGLFVAAIAGVPPALYHARYGEAVNPLSPDATLAAAVVAGLVVLGVGVLAGSPALSAVTAVVVVLAAADYRDTRGGPLAPRLEFALVAVTLGGAALAVGYFALTGAPTLGLLVGSALLALGAFFAIGER
ncbi:hypothetical protein [Halorarius halobius]|uniref:hypothetical protein n=1 Tax=Halorarius halobius TaxID=2962671 RepID=UPI0020CD3FF8|nr:hypothetical protein [Halorarius halobius]